MRTLLIRTTTLGGLMVLIAFAEGTEELRVQLLEALRVRFPQITSLYYMVNTKFNDAWPTSRRSSTAVPAIH